MGRYRRWRGENSLLISNNLDANPVPGVLDLVEMMARSSMQIEVQASDHLWRPIIVACHFYITLSREHHAVAGVSERPCSQCRHWT